MNVGRPPAVLVDKTDADETIVEMKRQGWYDSDRHIREVDSGRLEIPITAPPPESDEVSITYQTDPPWRIRELTDYLRRRGLSEAVIDSAPRSWAVIGDIVLVYMEHSPHERAVGEALLELHGSAHTVVAREGIRGAHREPAVRVIAGEGTTETTHVEYGTTYSLDLAKVMFSPGNKAERRRMGTVVEPGEIVLDMFAGIGYFSLPMARSGARVTAIERNPIAFEYLLENRVRNGLETRLRTIRGDCGTIVPRLAHRRPIADRVIMGHYDATPYLGAAVAALRPGGMLHLHTVGPADAPLEETSQALAERDLEITDRRVVKTHAPGMVHAVVDAVLPAGSTTAAN